MRIKTQYNNVNTNVSLLRDTTFNRPCNISKVKNKNKNERTIFVSIASYRDDECPNTLNSLLSKASNPSRVYVGICQQNHFTDVDCLNDTKYSDNPNIKIIRLEDFEAKGPTYARYICSKLYNGEDYYMQIDSHIHFVQDWDNKLIDMIDSIGYERSVITYQPKDWKDENKMDNSLISTYCELNYKSDINLFISYASLVPNKQSPVITPYCSACFFFTYGCFLNEVPFDPNLSQLFEGEEGLFSIRLWTSGWNMYAPNSDICFHYYIRADKPKYWTNPDYSKFIKSTQHKVRVLMGLEDIKSDDNFINDFKLYGLGSVRSLDEYHKFIGYNKYKKSFDVDFC